MGGQVGGWSCMQRVRAGGRLKKLRCQKSGDFHDLPRSFDGSSVSTLKKLRKKMLNN